MKLTFHGAARTVTGSQHLIELDGYRILLDCGLYQGKRKEAFERNRRLPFDPQSIDVLVLSHAHIDHSGNIPGLVKHGFQGDIICTSATRDLCAWMLADSGHIQERDVEYVNKKRRKEGKNPFEPLYTEEDAHDAMRLFRTQEYGRACELVPGIALRYVDAGHMLGSASVILDIEDQQTHRDVRLVFSGDVGRDEMPILRDPQPVTEGADILIMESTYGDRQHPPMGDVSASLKEIVQRVVQARGFLLIPAFAVGRTQQIVYELHQLYRDGEIPPVDVYVDSPLATNVTQVFRSHPEVFDTETRAFLLRDDVENPFGFDMLRYTRSVEDSKRLNTMEGPAVIISASGMAEHGRILHHLKNHIEDPASVVLFVGWQGPDTLGRYLLEGRSPVRIFGEEYPVEAQVEKLDGFSGHADRDGLLNWVRAMGKKPRRTFLVHGEEASALALAGALKQELGLPQVDVPEMHQSFELGGEW